MGCLQKYIRGVFRLLCRGTSELESESDLRRGPFFFFKGPLEPGPPLSSTSTAGGASASAVAVFLSQLRRYSSICSQCLSTCRYYLISPGAGCRGAACASICHVARLRSYSWCIAIIDQIAGSRSRFGRCVPALGLGPRTSRNQPILPR
jgi:hypothetical protein